MNTNDEENKLLQRLHEVLQDCEKHLSHSQIRQLILDIRGQLARTAVLKCVDVLCRVKYATYTKRPKNVKGRCIYDRQAQGELWRDISQLHQIEARITTEGSYTLYSYWSNISHTSIYTLQQLIQVGDFLCRNLQSKAHPVLLAMQVLKPIFTETKKKQKTKHDDETKNDASLHDKDQTTKNTNVKQKPTTRDNNKGDSTKE